MSPLHMVIRSSQYMQRKERIADNNYPFTGPLICLLSVTAQHEIAEVLMSGTPIYPKHHCSA